MSPLTEAMIINGAVLIATLECDLGPHRKIGPLRLLRAPLMIARSSRSDGLILMAVTMVLVRTAALAARTAKLPSAAPVARASAAMSGPVTSAPWPLPERR